MTSPKFTVFKGKNGRWFWNLKAANGEIICSHGQHNSKQAAVDGFRSVQRNAPLADIG